MFNDAGTSALTKTILMTVDAVGGVLTYALTLASELAKSGTKVHTTRSSRARPRAFAVSAMISMRAPGSQRAKRKSPVPTGLRAKGAVLIASGAMLPSRCDSRMCMWYVASMNCCGMRRLNQNTGVSESRTDTESMLPSRLLTGEPMVSEVYVANEKRTSSARTGAPSCQRAMESRWKAMLSESVAQSQRVARRGSKPRSPIVSSSGPISARRSNTAETIPMLCEVA